MNPLLLLPLLCLCLFACTTKSIQYQSPEALANSGPTATIYLIKTALDGGWTKGKVYVDDQLIGRMGSSCYLKAKVPTPTRRQILIRTALGQDTEVPLTIQSGGEYFFEYVVQTTTHQVKVLLRPLNGDAGRMVLGQVQKQPILRKRSTSGE